jgi:hypothetical protein
MVRSSGSASDDGERRLRKRRRLLSPRSSGKRTRFRGGVRAGHALSRIGANEAAQMFRKALVLQPGDRIRGAGSAMC